jgi:hypothetical protein
MAQYMLPLIFVETGVFSRQRREHLEEEQFRTLQRHVLEHPQAGAQIRALVGSGRFGGVPRAEGSVAASE